MLHAQIFGQSSSHVQKRSEEYQTQAPTARAATSVFLATIYRRDTKKHPCHPHFGCLKLCQIKTKKEVRRWMTKQRNPGWSVNHLSPKIRNGAANRFLHATNFWSSREFPSNSCPEPVHIQQVSILTYLGHILENKRFTDSHFLQPELV